MRQDIEEKLKKVCKELYGISVNLNLERPIDNKFGDYTTNIAFKLAPQLSKPPKQIAEEITKKLQSDETNNSIKCEIAGQGFINITLSDSELIRLIKKDLNRSLNGQVVVAEYSDPNPFKVLHAGHLYTSLVGDAVSNLIETAGAKVYRVNFGGDVGLHVGITMWAIIKELGGENPDKLNEVAEQDKLTWLSELYVKGNIAYEEDEQSKQEIVTVNKRVYDIHNQNDHESNFSKIYWICREWSYSGFDDLYKQLKMSPFDKYYPESAVADLGLETVKQHIGEVYQESEGAVVFDGEKYGLFTQVFINSEGLPTYAAKDVGLIFQKQADFNPNRSFIITDIAQKDHLAVVLKSISLYSPDLVEATTHFTHGQIKMSGGVKMSSRKGNVLRADDVIDAAKEASLKLNQKSNNDDIVLAAIKYAFLKNRIGGDIIYDPNESVSLEGKSGPYLQYAHARARSILRNLGYQSNEDINLESIAFDNEERQLVRKLTEYSEVLEKSISELMPHHICNYLYELAQEFNRFYEKAKVIGSERESLRAKLVLTYADILKQGLAILHIPTPDKM